MAVWGWWGKAVLNIYRHCRDAASWRGEAAVLTQLRSATALQEANGFGFSNHTAPSTQEDQLQHLRGHAWGKLIAQFCRRIVCVLENKLQVDVRVRLSRSRMQIPSLECQPSESTCPGNVE